jgi:hypothetical protein
MQISWYGLISFEFFAGTQNKNKKEKRNKNRK